MRITDIPEFKDKSSVLIFDETTPLQQIIEVMAQKNQGACLATQNGKLSGIFTERDLLRKVAATAIDPQSTTLKNVMTKNPKTAMPEDDVTDCLRRMTHGHFRHIPVVDDSKNILGMLSQEDFVSHSMGEVIERLRKITDARLEAGQGSRFNTVMTMIVYALVLLFMLYMFR